MAPSGITSTGWPAVRDTAEGFGVEFDSWQDGAGRLILAKRADGTYAASIGGVVISIPRQVGKTFLIGAIVFALCLLNPGLTVLWTAHRLRTANETFAKMQSFARRKKVKPHVAKVILGAGDEAISFHNGSRILFGARERGFGRGFDDVDVEVFDEAQILTEVALDDMVPATNVAKNPLLIFMGTPPKPNDPGEVFKHKRSEALSGEDSDTAYIELSADPDADPEDRNQWVKANPSYPARTSEAAMLRMRKNLTQESFVREGLGVWDATAGTVIDVLLWAALIGEIEGQRPDPVALSVVVSEDGKWTTIALAGLRSDGRRHLQIIEAKRGTAWAPDRLKALCDTWKASVAVMPSSPAGALVATLEAKKVPLLKVNLVEAASACGALVHAVEDATITHAGNPVVATAIGGADKQRAGEQFRWKQRSDTDISPLWAVTLALYGLSKSKKRTQRSGPRRAVVM